MDQSSTLSIGGPLFDTPANQTIVPQVRPPYRSEEFEPGRDSGSTTRGAGM